MSAAEVPAAPSAEEVVPLNVTGYNDVASRGDPTSMSAFIERLVISQGGRIRDSGAAALRQLAAKHALSRGRNASDASVVLSFRHLQHELEAADWIESSTLPGSSHSCTSPHTLVSGAGGHVHLHEEAYRHISHDFIGSVPSDTTLPSAPPPTASNEGPACCAGGSCAAEAPEGASAPSAPCLHFEGGTASVSGPDLEVDLQDSSLVPSPAVDLGALCVYEQEQPPSWNPMSWLLREQTFVVVLRHPVELGRGLRLFEASSRAEAADVAKAIARQLNPDGADRVSQEIYMEVYNDRGLRNGLARLHADHEARAAATTGAAGGASSSSASPAAAATAEGGPSEVSGDCPICFCEIEPGDAAMRCSGQGGQHHYFHSHCMQRWIEQCRTGRGATCPLCRGSIQFNAQRLEDFLSGAQSAGLSSEDRSFLQQCAATLKRAGGSWGEALTWENAAHVGGIAAAGGWGFMIGYTQPPPTLQYHMTLDMMSREQNIAQSAGWVLGLIARICREHYKAKREREERSGRSA